MRPLAGRMWWSFYQPDVTFDHFVTRVLMSVTGQGRAQLDEDPATAVGGTSDGPRDEGTSSADARHLRRTADVRAGRFLRVLATSGGASRVLITSRLLPGKLETPIGQPIAGCARQELGG
jgi:hypothetical protein